MQPRFTLILGTLGLAAALVAAPVGVQDNIASLQDKSAFAGPGGNNGNRGGNGHGNGHGRGHGNSASTSAHGGSSPGKSGSAPGHGGTGHGHEIDGVSGVGPATAPGQAKKAAYDGMYDKLDVKGSFNAIHSAAINKGVAAPQSRVARVKDYLDAIQRLDALQDQEDPDATDSDLEAAIAEAAEAAEAASSQPVTERMLDEVNDFANKRQLVDPAIDLDPDTTKEVAEEAGKI